MERISESHHLMLDEAQCKSYNDSFQTHKHEIKTYIELYKDKVGIESGTIIDIGSGSCNFIIALCIEFPNLNVVCYEDSDEMIKLAKTNIENNKLSNRITIIKDDLFNATGRYDAVLANRILHHINDTNNFWNLINRLSSKVLVVDIERFDDEDDLNNLANFIKPLLEPIFYEDTINSFRAAYSYNEVLEKVSKYNFKVSSIKAGPGTNLDIWYKKLIVHHNK